MALGPHDLAILSARMGVMRMGASRMGFCPDDVKHSGDEPGEYNWKEQKPPTTSWALQSQMSMCGKRRVALVLDADPNPQQAGLAVQFSALASGGWPPYDYRWHFGETQAIPGVRDPLMFWRMSEPAGQNKLDYFGGSQLEEKIAAPGTILQVDGKIGKAVEFTTDTAFLQPVVTGELAIPAGDFTIDFWFYPLSGVVGNQYLFSYGDSSLIGTVSFHIFPFFFSGVRFFTDASTFAETANAFNADAWNHIRAWHDSGASTNYVQLNGGAIASAAGPDAAASAYTRFGRHAGSGAQFHGALDAFGIWPFLLTGGEGAILDLGVEPESSDAVDLQNPQHIYLAAGVYTAECRAVDEFGNSDTETIDVTITAAPVTHVIVSGTILYTGYSFGSPFPTPPWPGVTVELFTSLSVSLGTVVADANGFYEFVDATPAGTSVYVQVSAQLPPGETELEAGSSSIQTTITGTLTINLTCRGNAV